MGKKFCTVSIRSDEDLKKQIYFEAEKSGVSASMYLRRMFENQRKDTPKIVEQSKNEGTLTQTVPEKPKQQHIETESIDVYNVDDLGVDTLRRNDGALVI